MPTAQAQHLRTLVASFSTWSFIAFTLQVMAMFALYRAIPDIARAPIGSLYTISFGVIALLALLLVWLRAARSLRVSVLLHIDAAFVLLINLEFGVSAYLSRNLNGNVFTLFVLNLFLLVGHALVVPTSRRSTAILAGMSMLPLTVASILAPPHLGGRPLPLPVVVAGVVLFAAGGVVLVTWVRGSGAEVALRRPEVRSNSGPEAIPRLLTPILRPALQIVQYLCVRIANVQRLRPSSRKHHSWDLLLAHRLSSDFQDGDALLDVGCGLGRRLHEIAMFRRLKRACGVDVVSPPDSYASDSVELRTFDGRTIPYSDKSFDVTMVCYVLHHMPPEHAQRLLQEIVRVTRRTILVLEDSLPTWSVWYRLRNWCHRVDKDLEYSAGADDYVRPVGQSMFLTHGGWTKRLAALPRAQSVTCESLKPPMKYAHHTMFRIQLDG